MLQSSGFSPMLKVIWYQVPLSHRQWVSLPVQLQCLALQLHSVHGCCAVLCSAVLCCAMQCCAVLCCAAQCCAHPRVRCTAVACHLQQHTAEDSARLSTGCISMHTMRLAGCCPALLYIGVKTHKPHMFLTLCCSTILSVTQQGKQRLVLTTTAVRAVTVADRTFGGWLCCTLLCVRHSTAVLCCHSLPTTTDWLVSC
jgi:hypothetical protein